MIFSIETLLILFFQLYKYFFESETFKNIFSQIDIELRITI